MAQFSVFLGDEEPTQIEVHTDPHIEDLNISGRVRLPSGTIVDLNFQDGDMAPFTPSEEEAYEVEVTVEKENYRPSHLSATFYYRKEEPDISEFSAP